MLLQLEKKARNSETVPEAANPAKAAALTRTTLLPNRGWDRKASPKSHHMPLAFFSQIRLPTLTAASSCPLLLSLPSLWVLDVPHDPSHPHNLVLPHLPHTSGQVPAPPIAQRIHQLSVQLHVYLGVSRGVPRLLHPDITVCQAVYSPDVLQTGEVSVAQAGSSHASCAVLLCSDFNQTLSTHAPGKTSSWRCRCCTW